MSSTVSTTLTEDQIEFLRRYGQTRETKAGQVLFRGSGRPRSARFRLARPRCLLYFE
jgi:hypothetical protein